MSKEKVGTIYSETDYSRFRFLLGNRNAKSIGKVKKSIQEVGYVSCPIMVNEHMEIIDGQNRFYALQDLGLPVEYYMVKGVGINEARSMNIGRSNWTTKDWVESYMKEGNTNYMRLYDISTRLYIHSTITAYYIAVNTPNNSGGASSIITTGKVKITEEQHNDALKVCDQINKMSDAIDNIPSSGTRGVISTLAWCLRVQGVDQERLTRLFITMYPALRPVVDVLAFLVDLSDMYNKNLRKENKIYFDAIYRQLGSE